MATMKVMTIHQAHQMILIQIPTALTVIAMIVAAIVKAATVIVKVAIVPNVVAAKSAKS